MIQFFLNSFLLTLRSPRAGLRRILDLRFSEKTGALAVLLSGVISALLIHTNIAMMPAELQTKLMAIFGTPFQTAAVQALAMGGMALLLWKVGRAFGGRGDLSACLASVAWFQGVLILLQCAQIVLDLALPPLAGIIALFTLGLIVVLLILFPAEVHGFQNLFAVLAGVIVTGFAALWMLSFVLSFFISPEALQELLATDTRPPATLSSEVGSHGL